MSNSVKSFDKSRKTPLTSNDDLRQKLCRYHVSLEVDGPR